MGSTRCARWARWFALGLAVLVLALTAGPGRTARVSGQTAAAVYPDLRTLVPSDLRFDTVAMADGWHNVLRLSNTVANLGQDPLELVGELQLHAFAVSVAWRLAPRALPPLVSGMPAQAQ